MVLICTEWWCTEANEATQTHCYNPVVPAYPIWIYYAHGRQRRCQKDPVSLPSGRLEKTTRSSPHHVARSAPSNRIWNITTLRSPKQQVWLRTALCGGWCRRMALRNVRVACQKWQRRSTGCHEKITLSDIHCSLIIMRLIKMQIWIMQVLPWLRNFRTLPTHDPTCQCQCKSTLVLSILIKSPDSLLCPSSSTLVLRLRRWYIIQNHQSISFWHPTLRPVSWQWCEPCSHLWVSADMYHVPTQSLLTSPITNISYPISKVYM